MPNLVCVEGCWLITVPFACIPAVFQDVAAMLETLERNQVGLACRFDQQRDSRCHHCLRTEMDNCSAHAGLTHWSFGVPACHLHSCLTATVQ